MIDMIDVSPVSFLVLFDTHMTPSVLRPDKEKLEKMEVQQRRNPCLPFS